MKLSVYYDEIDGQLNPQWILLPSNTGDEYAVYSLEAPFERFWPEDFHDSMAVVTVTQAALAKDPFMPHEFSISTSQVLADLTKNGGNMEFYHEAEYFMVRMDDLEEVMQMNVRRFFLE